MTSNDKEASCEDGYKERQGIQSQQVGGGEKANRKQQAWAGEVQQGCKYAAQYFKNLSRSARMEHIEWTKHVKQGGRRQLQFNSVI